MKKQTWKVTLLPLIFSLVLAGIDQLTKWFAVTYLKPIGSLPVWDGVLHFTYAENTGAVFSILTGKTSLLSFITILGMVFLVYLLISERWIKHQPLLNWSLGLVIGGGIGNLIDRLTRHFVVDFIDIRLINFAIFNFADCCVTVGVALMLIYFLFMDGKKGRPSVFREQG